MHQLPRNADAPQTARLVLGAGLTRFADLFRFEGQLHLDTLHQFLNLIVLAVLRE